MHIDYEFHAEPLGRGGSVFVSAEYRFSTDTILLADFSMPIYREVCADIGTGCGTIPLLWRMRGNPKSITAVEIQPAAAQLAEKSVQANGFSSEITVVCGDVREYKTILPNESFDLMACNPPYFTLGSGYKSTAPAEKTARHDECMTISDLASAAKFGLKWGGRLCICLPTVRLAEAIEAFRTAGLEPKRLRLVQSTPKKAPYLFLLECKKGGKTGLAVEQTLILNDINGKATPELNKIYGDYLDTAGREK